ncbi:MAG: tyrosine-type recombinase/integrase [Muribaculaceae bacterium]|nr:tyrosine-type recombinase/integrase [Muribaculaceae bacterium]
MKTKATIRIVLDTKHKEAENKLLKLRITHHREARLYSIGDDTIRLTKKQFENHRLKKTTEAMDVAKRAQQVAEVVIEELGSDFTFEVFKDRYHRKLAGGAAVSSSLNSLLAEYFEFHHLSYKSKKSYETSVNWVIRYKGKATLSNITSEFVDGLISFMKHEHAKEHGNEMSENTLRIYLRQLRALMNFAISKGHINGPNPFANMMLESIERQKAALSDEELDRLIKYTPQNKVEEVGKDFFLLSIHCFGANLGDILLFRNSNIDENGKLSFVRRKTRRKNAKPIDIPLTNYAKAIFNKYGKISASSPNSLILPYLAHATSETNVENIIKKRIRIVNAGLKSISEALGLRKITTYTARHTIATKLRNGDTPTEVIQKLLGHRSSKTTEIYLGSLSTEKLDKAKDVLDSLGCKA